MFHIRIAICGYPLFSDKPIIFGTAVVWVPLTDAMSARLSAPTADACSDFVQDLSDTNLSYFISNAFG